MYVREKENQPWFFGIRNLDACIAVCIQGYMVWPHISEIRNPSHSSLTSGTQRQRHGSPPFPRFLVIRSFFPIPLLPFVPRVCTPSPSPSPSFPRRRATIPRRFEAGPGLRTPSRASGAMAHPMYGSGPLRSRNAASSDEIQLRIDPVHGDLDEEIDGLHSRVRMLKGQMTLAKAQAGVKNNMRRLNKSIIQQGSNHVLHVVLFALFCFMVVYLLSKFSRR
ncbi:hypothetical protein PVAP13_2NG555909 [Panicum virgatum]|uniref:Bet1-like protein n=2 Tax=Panicum virgatum TaxID=38727 RepID=A0A8T0VT02_PANVG|nr:hypothetical protein PVAP13_2NG555909 [Panicum virgatum]